MITGMREGTLCFRKGSPRYPVCCKDVHRHGFELHMTRGDYMHDVGGFTTNLYHTAELNATIAQQIYKCDPAVASHI